MNTAASFPKRCIKPGRSGPASHTAAALSRRAVGLAGALFLGGLATVAANRGARAEGDAPLAERYVDAFARLQAIEAEIEICRDERRVVESTQYRGSDGDVVRGMATLPGAARASLQEMILRTNEPFPTELFRAVKVADDRRDELAQQWRGIRGQLAACQNAVYAARSDRDVAAQLASLLSVDNRWFWLGGVVAVAAVVLVVMHYRRHEIRRALHGSRGRGLAPTKFLLLLWLALALVTGATFWYGDRLYQFVLSASGATPPAVELEHKVNELDRRAEIMTPDRDAARRELDATTEKVREAARRAAGDAEPRDAVNEFQRQQAAASEALRRLRVSLTVETALARELKSDVAQLEPLRQEALGISRESSRYGWWKRLIAGILGSTLLGIAATGGLALGRSVRKRRKVLRDTCPRCLHRGSFRRSTVDGGENIECHYAVSQEPYEECRYSFPSAYRELDKVCYPTLGIAQAGKTHWLLTTYRELSQGRYPEEIRFEKLKTQASEDFDRFVEETLRERFNPQATQTDRLPHPLVFNFADRDRYGSSNLLINLLDYSGEVMKKEIDDFQRRRALDADGYLLFVDPTVQSEDQEEALAAFRRDVQRIRGLGPRDKLRSPVAVVVSKIDMLLSQPYGLHDLDGSVGRFYDEMRNIGWELNIRDIERRSRATAKLAPIIWPGWNIERHIRDLFGERYLFFPLTPVGLQGILDMEQDDLRDLTRRVISPVGILAPLLWLTHMNGYPVMK